MADQSGSFYDFQQLCNQIEAENSYNEKTTIVATFVKTFKGDLYLLCKLLLARDDRRVYNIREKQMAKILSRSFEASLPAMISDLDKGDMSETARKFFEASGKAQKRSTLTLKQVDQFLDKLTTVTKEDDQFAVINDMLDRCTAVDLKFLWKIMDKDLKINIGAKFVLTALHPKAFDAFKNSNNLKLIVERVQNHTLDAQLKEDKDKSKEKTKELNTQIELMLPVKPMLARACKSMEEAIKRCPNGLYTEVKYDGERLQVHKKGDEFEFFSRNLKKVRDYKIEGVKEYLPKATKAKDIILDGEILLMDTEKRKPLPFGTLGIHKKQAFKDATLCIFLFDILYIDGKSLMNTPFSKRREILESNVKVIPNRIEIAEQTLIKDAESLGGFFTKIIREGLEGLVIKDSMSVYEPSARHWLKMKKDYIAGMADSADLLVLGAYYGTGNKGGLMSSFLMGCYDASTNTYKTVCKVANGHDDATIDRLQKELKDNMLKISKDATKLPKWLDIAKPLAPDFVCRDPKKTQIWEIEGAEFSETSTHTAGGYSIRFPRVTRIRDDKDWNTATTLQEFLDLVKASKQNFELPKGKGGVAKKNTGKAKSKKSTSSSAEEEASEVSEVSEVSEEESKPKKKPQTKNDGIMYLNGKDILTPIGNEPSKFIINCADNSGKWGNRGLFAYISSKYKKPEEKFNQAPGELGELQVIKVDNQGDSKVYIATMVAQLATSKGIPPLDTVAFEECIQSLASVVKERSGSVHFPKLTSKIPGMDWDGFVVPCLSNYLVSQKIPVFIYLAPPSAPTSNITTKSKAQVKNESEDEPMDIDKDITESKPLVTKRTVQEADSDESDDRQLKKQKGSTNSNLFKEVNVVFAGDKNYSSAKRKILEMGGSVSQEWVPYGSKETTHLICGSKSQPLYQHVNLLGGFIVNDKWIEDSYTKQEKLPEDGYRVDIEQLSQDYESSDPQDQPITTTTVTSKATANTAVSLRNSGNLVKGGIPDTPAKFELLDIFSGISAVLFDPIESKNLMRRYIVAYEGDTTNDPKEATHIVTDGTWTEQIEKMFKQNTKLKVVESKWIWESVNQRSLQPDRPYFIRRVRTDSNSIASHTNNAPHKASNNGTSKKPNQIVAENFD